MIKDELQTKKSQLEARTKDLEKAVRLVSELGETCALLKTEISDLEHDENALTRGYIAIMADNSVGAKGNSEANQ